MWCSAADTHLKLLNRVVSGACFLAGGVLNCNVSHRRSVAVLIMLYKIGRNPMHPLCGALPVPYVPVRVTRGALIAHRYIWSHIGNNKGAFTCTNNNYIHMHYHNNKLRVSSGIYMFQQQIQFYALIPWLIIIHFVYDNHVLTILTCCMHRVKSSCTNNCNMQN